MRIDRRAARTRATLHDALKGLMRRHGYEALSVSDICDAAEVGRSTFYGHFTGKDDLRRNGLGHLKSALRASSTERFGFTRALFTHARSHAGLCDGPDTALRAIIAELVGEDLRAVEPDRQQRALRTAAVTGAILSVLSWWLDDGARLPPDEVDARLKALIV